MESNNITPLLLQTKQLLKAELLNRLPKLLSPITPPSPPVEVPSGSDFGHAVMAIRVIGFSPTGILEGTTANRVNTNEQDEHDYVEDREFVPIPPDGLKHPCLTRIALIA